MAEGTKHAGGRPRKYKSPEEMQSSIDRYFAGQGIKTICGLAIALGFSTRQSLLDYEGYSKEFLDTIKKAKLRIEAGYETDLRSKHTTGAIFALKNFGWTDKREYQHDITPELATVLGLIDGSSKGKLPDSQEGEDAG